MIRIEGVSKHYDDKPAVQDLDLEIAAGTIFGFIGPNGAGKTTTLMMLATLIKPDTGTIRIDGLDPYSGVRGVRERIGYMPDAFGVFRGLSCEEYLRFFGRLYGLRQPALDERLAAVLDLTDLDRVREELTSALSTGMRQRLSLAKTLLHDPEILILDEPASGLDPRARVEIRSLLTELGRMGKTIVISSHILADLEEICSDVGIIESGHLVWHGSLSTALEARDHETFAVIVDVAEDRRVEALEALEALACISSVVDNRGRLRAEVRDAGSNEVLRALVERDIEVVSFTREKASLESLFLERTKGIVS